MLKLLSITNFAIIERLDLELAPGLTVLTGETGAGKSIIIGALDLLLGGRADSTMVRSGESGARVEGIFDLSSDLENRLRSDLDDDPIGENDEIILARDINLEGRNLCRINDRIVPLSLLQRVGNVLADVHGQSQHLSITQASQQLDILDRYANAEGLRSAVTGAIQKLTELRSRLQTLRTSERETAQRVDLLQFQIDEITGANLVVGEDGDLEREQNQVANAQRLLSLSEEAYRLLNGSQGGLPSVSDIFDDVLRQLSDLASVDSSTGAMRDTAQELQFQMQEFGQEIRAYNEGIEYSPARLEEIEERLDLINLLKRKYGDTIEAVLAFAENAQGELDALVDQDRNVEELTAGEQTLRFETGKLAARLSDSRSTAAALLSKAIELELSELALENARVEIDVSQRASAEGLPVPVDNGTVKNIAYTSTGVDSVEFRISPNTGEPPEPVSKIASGGETSRLMLAVRVTLSGNDDVPTLVFDEIDAGIGGIVGFDVGRKLWQLSRHHQVLCITHLTQIAAFADQHVMVSKKTTGDRTLSGVQIADQGDRVRELTRMLGAAGNITRESAREILDKAESLKSSDLEQQLSLGA
jgi:DNA repair protein RecN (Recombination protein N)